MNVTFVNTRLGETENSRNIQLHIWNRNLKHIYAIVVILKHGEKQTLINIQQFIHLKPHLHVISVVSKLKLSVILLHTKDKFTDWVKILNVKLVANPSQLQDS